MKKRSYKSLLALLGSLFFHVALLAFISFGGEESPSEVEEMSIQLSDEIFQSLDQNQKNTLAAQKTVTEFNPLDAEKAASQAFEQPKIAALDLSNAAAYAIAQPERHNSIEQKETLSPIGNEVVTSAKTKQFNNVSTIDEKLSVRDVAMQERQNGEVFTDTDIAKILVPKQVSINEGEQSPKALSSDNQNQILTSNSAQLKTTTRSSLLLSQNKITAIAQTQATPVQKQSKTTLTLRTLESQTMRISNGSNQNTINKVTLASHQQSEKDKAASLKPQNKTLSAKSQSAQQPAPIKAQDENDFYKSIELPENIRILENETKKIVLTQGDIKTLSGDTGKGLLTTKSAGSLSNVKRDGVVKQNKADVLEDQRNILVLSLEQGSIGQQVSPKQLNAERIKALQSVKITTKILNDISQDITSEAKKEIEIPTLSTISEKQNLSAQSGKSIKPQDSQDKLETLEEQSPDDEQSYEASKKRIDIDPVQLAVNQFMGDLYRALTAAQFYPEEAKEQELEGRVIVRFTVKSNGQVENLEIIQSSGHDVLDKAALETINKASPFAALPDQLNRKKLTFSLPINFAKKE